MLTLREALLDWEDVDGNNDDIERDSGSTLTGIVSLD